MFRLSGHHLNYRIGIKVQFIELHFLSDTLQENCLLVDGQEQAETAIRLVDDGQVHHVEFRAKGKFPNVLAF